MDKTETIVQLKKMLASKKAADLLKALKKLQRNYFPEFGNTVVDIFEERYKRNHYCPRKSVNICLNTL